MKKRVIACLSLAVLAGCVGGPPRFKVSRTTFEQQVHSIAISPCEYLAAFPYVFEGITDPAQFQSLLCATTEAHVQRALASSGRYGLVGSERCRVVKDSVTQVLAASNWRNQDPADAGLLPKQLFAKTYYQQLGADATLLVFFSTISESKNTISPYQDKLKNEEGYQMSTGIETHLVLAARLVGLDNKTLWNNSVMLNRRLDKGDKAADIFKAERVNDAVMRLLKDLTK